MNRSLENLRHDAGVVETDTPEEAGAKVAAEAAEQFGEDATYELHPDQKAEMTRRQESFDELATMVRRGRITRGTAAIEWELRHGTPASTARVAQIEGTRVLTEKPAPLSPAALAAERRAMREQVFDTLARDPVHSRLRFLEGQLNNLKKEGV